jgi:hypothetical protein
METTEFSVIGPQDLIKDLITYLPEKDSRISVKERPAPSPEKGGAAAEPFTLALLGVHVFVAVAVLYEAGTVVASVIKKWFHKPDQQNRECELLIRNHSGEEHRIKLTVAMSENEIAEIIRDFTE